MRYALVLALLVPAVAGAEVVIEAPAKISFYEAPAIRITGLVPLDVVAVVTTMKDARGIAYTSRVTFRPDLDGVIDTTRSIANGDYEGIDPMGPFWSAKGEGFFQFPLKGSLPATIHVEDRDGHDVASRDIERVVVADDVTVTSLRPPDAPFAGNLYVHPGDQKRPIVITLTGSAGGIDPWIAPWVVSQGFDVLSLGYFHAEGLPEHLIEQPLEYFLETMKWLEKRPTTSSIGIVGVSKGAEASLVIASYFPTHVAAIGAWFPTHLVWEGIDTRSRLGGDASFRSPGKSSWTLDGKPLPFVRRFFDGPPRQRRGGGSLDAHVPRLDGPIDPAAWIPVERIQAAVFMISAGNDLAWPSQRMAREVKKRMEKRRGGRDVQLHEYPMAGHGVFPPGAPVTIGLGGTRTGNANASADAWTGLRAFLRANLR